MKIDAENLLKQMQEIQDNCEASMEKNAVVKCMRLVILAMKLEDGENATQEMFDKA